MKHSLDYIQRKLRKTTWIAAGIILFFLTSAFVLLYGVSYFLQREHQEYLSEVTKHYSDTIQKQIEGDLLILQGIITFFDPAQDDQVLIEQLQIQNNQNPFIRMAYIDETFMGTMVDMSGAIYYDQDFSKEKVVHRAMKGMVSVSEIRDDKYSRKPIMVYAAPIYEGKQVIGVLTATKQVSFFSKEMYPPAFGNDSVSMMIKKDGEVLLSSKILPTMEAQKTHNFFEHAVFEPAAYDELLRAMQRKKPYTFYADIHGKKNWCNLHYLGYNDWYLLETIPADSLNEGYHEMILIFIITVIFLIAVFVFLMFYTKRVRTAYSTYIERLAYHDEVTGAYNATRFTQLATELIQKDKNYTLVLVDIHDFRFINSSFGFAVGDRLLQNISYILKRMTKEDELYYHRFADQFGILLHTQDIDDIIIRVTQLMDQISALQLIPNEQHPIHCYCGIKLNQMFSDNLNIGLLQDRAAIALNHIKELHGNHYAFYDHTLLEEAQYKNAVELRMHAALQNREFVPYLQPKYSLQTGEIVNAEALVRWKKPDGTLVPPNEFIPIFEQNGFIVQLDLYILEEVCKYQRKWKEQGFAIVPISVNQSRLLFYQEQYADTVYQMVSKYQLHPSCIVLEVTESVATDNVAEMAQVIDLLHKYGFGVSMDDFGSGYSSLNVLRKISIDELKLDRDFLSNTQQSEKGSIILQSIIRLARKLSITTVCEGVETPEQAEMLQRIGCDIAQGYFFARPMDVNAFESLTFRQKK